MQSKVVVTGSHGFIGRNLISALTKDKNSDVVAFEREKIGKKDYVYKILEGAGSLVHLAGLTKGTEEEFYEANVGFTEKLLEYFKLLTNKPKLIFASSFAVYGTQSNNLKETSLLKPRSPYGESKLKVEKIIRKYAQRYNFSAVILRFANIYGPGMPPYTHSVISTFLDQARKDISLTINGNGNQERDFVYVDDLIKAIRKTIFWKGKIGETEIINISSGGGISLNRLVGKVATVTGKKVRVFYRNKKVKEEGCWIGDNTKAKKLLGWLSETSLKKGLTLTFKSLMG